MASTSPSHAIPFKVPSCPGAPPGLARGGTWLGAGGGCDGLRSLVRLEFSTPGANRIMSSSNKLQAQSNLYHSNYIGFEITYNRNARENIFIAFPILPDPYLSNMTKSTLFESLARTLSPSVCTFLTFALLKNRNEFCYTVINKQTETHKHNRYL